MNYQKDLRISFVIAQTGLTLKIDWWIDASIWKFRIKMGLGVVNGIYSC